MKLNMLKWHYNITVTRELVSYKQIFFSLTFPWNWMLEVIPTWADTEQQPNL